MQSLTLDLRLKKNESDGSQFVRGGEWETES